MGSLAADLADFKVAHLYQERCIVRVRGVDDLRVEALEAVADSTASVTYRSRHGGLVTATDEIFRLLDTLLETRLPEAFTPLEERAHWEDDDEEAGPLPAGPGPYGSGVRGLGSTGERITLVSNGNLVLPDAGFGDEDDDAPHRREPWQEVTGAPDLLRAWLIGRMRWTMNDGDYTEFPHTEQERIQLAETQASRAELADQLLTAFPPERSRYFVGAHAGWDRWSEDYLSRDEVIAFASEDHVAVLWLALYRYYG
ncbi:hypothetical protein [Nonomuraea sp. NEAU-A123]|uniref:hypothetical protein n=1 Tax=Nonomuraea sp. NEAU-A123 TaxID=2839649 RepID=UPI001BE42A9B|nr:hypothetical protein [Nonomuraea sp. NEAU-A123]MBT2224366.1 hypothetical protein [Nonomuraea sp. NEAU-A123]